MVPKHLRIGLVDEVTEEGKGAEHGEAFATKITCLAPIGAMIASKKILHEQKTVELDRILEMESEMQKAMRKTADHLEGIRAFVEKRKPEFKGK